MEQQSQTRGNEVLQSLGIFDHSLFYQQQAENVVPVLYYSTDNAKLYKYLSLVFKVEDEETLHRESFDLILKYAANVIAYCFLRWEDPHALTVAQGFVRTFMGDAHTIGSMLSFFEQKLIWILFVKMGDLEIEIQNKARQSFCTVFDFIKTTIKQQTNIGQWLSERTLAIMYSAGRILRDGTLDEKLGILISSRHLIGLLESNCGIVKEQMISLLQDTALDPRLHNETAHIWTSLIRWLDDEALGSILSLATILLVELGKNPSVSAEVVLILESIYCPIRPNMKKDYSTLITLPATPAYEKARRAYENTMPPTPSNPIDQLQRSIQGLTHQHSEVQIEMIKRVRMNISRNLDTLHAIAISDDTSGILYNLVHTLITTMHRFAQRSQPVIRNSGSCLSIIGAMDPGRLDFSREDIAHDEEILVNSEINQLAFCGRFLREHLTTAFASTSSIVARNCIAYTLQEFLRIGGFSKSQNILRPNQAPAAYQDDVAEEWDDFSPSVQSMLRPFFNSRYQHRERPIPTLPVWPKCNTHVNWITSWSLVLIDQIFCALAKEVFLPIRATLSSGDIAFAKILLPYLLIHALENPSDEVYQGILAEAREVLASAGGDRTDVLQSLDAIFYALDRMRIWSNKQMEIHNEMLRRAKSRKHEKPTDSTQTRIAKRIIQLLADISALVLSNAAYESGGYERALMYMEQHLNDHEKTMTINDRQSHLCQLQRIYSFLNEPDGMNGIFRNILEPTLAEQIVDHKAASRWGEAQTCEELCLIEEPEALNHHIGLIDSLKHLGHYESMLTHIRGVIASNNVWAKKLNQYAIEAAWCLGKWDDAELLLASPHIESFETSLGSLLTSNSKTDQIDDAYTETYERVQATISNALASESAESYHKGYGSMLQLHVLQELEEAHQVKLELIGGASLQSLKAMLGIWNTRIRIVQDSYKSKEMIHNVRRHLLHTIAEHTAGEIRELALLETSNLWIQSAKSARKANFHQSAHSALLHANTLKNPYAPIEKAKWHWSQAQTQSAMSELNKALQNLQKLDTDAFQPFQLSGHGMTVDVPFLEAKSYLLLGKWAEDAGEAHSVNIIENFTQATILQPQYELHLRPCLPLKSIHLYSWDKAHYLLGRYHNRLYQTARETMNWANKKTLAKAYLDSTDYLVQLSKSYIESLICGSGYIYQTLPRLLTVWFDYCDDQQASDEERRSVLSQDRVEVKGKINMLITRLEDKIPAYYLMAVFPQLMSRLCHLDSQVHAINEKMIIKVLRAYPQQALWGMMASIKSTAPLRKRRAQEILSRFKSDSLGTLVKHAVAVAEQLLSICEHTVSTDKDGRVAPLSISRDFRNLKRMGPAPVMIPVQDTLMAQLPGKYSDGKQHNPFPSELVTIQGYQDEIDIMPSLQHPRKITIIGSDGNEYTFLCKPNDDMRKDARVMEFNTMINRLLKKSSDARARKLYIRTYAVVPLNETCGIIQWVSNTSGLRPILMKNYRNKGMVTSHAEIKDLMAKHTNLRDLYEKHLLKRHPPVFQEWFVDKFPEPTKWFQARLCYQRTVAVMSMVGYIIGLGDRHGENILFDRKTGDAVHVDFNCLFEKGLTFEKPERVPFRLTHNMISAFGVNKCEGVFRKCCEVTLSLLRANRESLLNVLETFVHDPFVEWSEKKNKAIHTPEQEKTAALQSLKKIKAKLEGVISGVSLTVEGQANELITQATDVNNLAAMYIGWASHY